MSDYIKLTSKSELPANNEAKEFSVGEKTVCIANVDGVFSAMDNVCLHRGGPIGQGVIEDGKVICPWHGWAWHPTSGEAAHNASAKVPVYPIRIEGEDVLIQI